jgi:hypothetical protein
VCLMCSMFLLDLDDPESSKENYKHVDEHVHTLRQQRLTTGSTDKVATDIAHNKP